MVAHHLRGGVRHARDLLLALHDPILDHDRRGRGAAFESRLHVLGRGALRLSPDAPLHCRQLQRVQRQGSGERTALRAVTPAMNVSLNLSTDAAWYSVEHQGDMLRLVVGGFWIISEARRLDPALRALDAAGCRSRRDRLRGTRPARHGRRMALAAHQADISSIAGSTVRAGQRAPGIPRPGAHDRP